MLYCTGTSGTARALRTLNYRGMLSEKAPRPGASKRVQGSVKKLIVSESFQLEDLEGFLVSVCEASDSSVVGALHFLQGLDLLVPQGKNSAVNQTAMDTLFITVIPFPCCCVHPCTKPDTNLHQQQLKRSSRAHLPCFLSHGSIPESISLVLRGSAEAVSNSHFFATKHPAASAA